MCPASLSKPQALEGAQLSSGFAGPAWCCGQWERIALASQNGLTGLAWHCSYKQSRELVQISLDPCFSWPPAFLMPGAVPHDLCMKKLFPMSSELLLWVLSPRGCIPVEPWHFGFAFLRTISIKLNGQESRNLIGKKPLKVLGYFKPDLKLWSLF